MWLENVIYKKCTADCDATNEQASRRIWNWKSCTKPEQRRMSKQIRGSERRSLHKYWLAGSVVENEHLELPFPPWLTFCRGNSAVTSSVPAAQHENSLRSNLCSQ